MNKEMKTFKKVIKKRIRSAGKAKFLRERRLSVIRKINEVKH